MGWFAQNLFGGWSDDERKVYGLAAKIAGPDGKVTANQLANSRGRSEVMLARIGPLGNGINVDYVSAHISGTPPTSSNGYARPNTNQFTFTDAGLNQEFEQSTRTFTHETSHAVLGLLDELVGYSGPIAPNIHDQRSSLGYWSGYRWEGIAMARTLGATQNHNDTYVCGTLAGGGC